MTKLHRFILPAAAGTFLASAPLLAQPDEHEGHHPGQEGATALKTPLSIASEHKALHETLTKAAGEAGELGTSARALESVLSPHFRREEEIATPPLALLPRLASRPALAEMRTVLPMTQALERELPQMLQEHGRVRTAVRAFRAVAERAGRNDYVHFADALAAHARQEEEILYPAAILVGKYVARTAPQR